MLYQMVKDVQSSYNQFRIQCVNWQMSRKKLDYILRDVN